jgi:amidophosphoribosyltransferase
MLASETVALDDAGITPDKQYHVREGEMVVINEEGIRFEWLEDEEPSEAPQHCMVEYGYLMKKKSRIEGAEIEAIREEMGRQLARTAPVEADIVIDVPNSGTPAARGFSEESGIPLVQALELNDDRRTFIEGEELRKILLADKFLLNPDLVRGLRVVMVDDSVIRGSTTIELNRMLRAAGAREVHVRSALPPNRYPCYMGLDTGNAETLIARDDRADNEIAHELEVDSMGYTTPEDIDAAINAVVEARFRRIGRVCRSCVTGKYPFPVPEADNGVKQPKLLGLPGVRRPGDRLLAVS